MPKPNTEMRNYFSKPTEMATSGARRFWPLFLVRAECLITGSLASTLVFLGSASYAAAPVGATAVKVEMKSISYAPKRIEITAGQSVVWRNVSLTEHSATAEGTSPAFSTGMIAPGKSAKPVVFPTPGQFVYHCSMHGQTMSGVVVVKAAP